MYIKTTVAPWDGFDLLESAVGALIVWLGPAWVIPSVLSQSVRTSHGPNTWSVCPSARPHVKNRCQWRGVGWVRKKTGHFVSVPEMSDRPNYPRPKGSS